MDLSTIDAQALNNKQKSIVAISALSAKGNLPALEIALNDGLDSGLTVNEIKEILIQLYAYCGFPRSLNAINTFSTVSEHRKANGHNDLTGIEPAFPGSADKSYQRGKENLEKLTGRSEAEVKTGYATFIPVIDSFLKEHLFADIFDRGVLTYQERELTTVSALASLGGVEPQLAAHLGISMHNGLTEPQLQEMLSIVEAKVGQSEANAGREVLSKMIKSR
jgi:4-carboxymuconolactone decarboxylase